MRKRIGIEDFLRWAYRDELPKAQPDPGLLGPAGYRGGMGGLERMAELGVRIDVPDNRYGVVPNAWGGDDPHPDAVRAAHAVEALHALELELPDGWNPIADMGELGTLGPAAVQRALHGLCFTHASGRRTLRPHATPRRLVFRHALLGGTPDWEGEAPVIALVTGGNGKPAWFRRETVMGEGGAYEIEVDGMDRKRRLPHPDAYQKPSLSPDPVETIMGRGEYEIWRSVLDLLHADLAPQLTAFTLEGCARPMRPWETGDLPKRRVIHSLLRVAAPPQKGPSRPLGRARRPASPVRHVLQGAA
ncbi:hypothetical protein OPKNFCMD_3851 [Methylobacterium crusticola]|uniref:Uncharacterized protein n=1 Tax=Methylobacterium crusticola TaxID=1697972 RepID=A0ABQ4R2B6_9HYPH|nr:hypothetical protein [Methylobacterium crusticola]GJD51100.1 hypothetical protein OPKNFCMD_3851 [Methylobacterium crusticola]